MIRYFCVLFFALHFVGCALLRDSSHQISEIRNSDIHWAGTAGGLLPSLQGASKKVLQRTEVNLDKLVDALKDENRYVASHVLLSTRTGYAIEQATGGIDPETGQLLPGTEFGAKFNGLRVELFANGDVVIPAGQKAEIFSKWWEWQKIRKSSMPAVTFNINEFLDRLQPGERKAFDELWQSIRVKTNEYPEGTEAFRIYEDAYRKGYAYAYVTTKGWRRDQVYRTGAEAAIANGWFDGNAEGSRIVFHQETKAMNERLKKQETPE